MPVFFTKQLNGQEAILDEEESRHLSKVLRLNADDPVELVDGIGRLYKGIITDADSRNAKVRIMETIEGHLARDFYLHLAIAPTKSADRFEWFLEKATEIGVEEITPILCERSERTRIRHDRSEKILLAAMKQSGRAYLPKLNPMIPFRECLERADADLKFIAHCGAGPGEIMEKPGPRDLSWLVLIGPEGDFSSEEVNMATAGNFKEISLGDAVYRTETAGIIACQLINYLNTGI